MLNSPVPHMATIAATTSSPTNSVRSPGSVAHSSTRSAGCENGCVAAKCPRSQGTRALRRGPPIGSTQSVQNRSDAVSPLLQRRQCARRDGIRRTGAGLVEEDQSTERRHRLDPPLDGRQLRKNLAVGEPVRDEHDVVRTLTRRAIGDAQVTVARIPRLREHCGSVGRGAGQVSVSCNEQKLERSSPDRCHHLLKTLWGWHDEQLRHGTVIWTAPSGQVYTTKPGGALFFPALATPTGQLVLPESSDPTPSNGGSTTPTRQRTRAQERAYPIALERQHNAARITENNSSSPSASPETTNHHRSDVERAAKQAIESC